MLGDVQRFLGQLGTDSFVNDYGGDFDPTLRDETFAYLEELKDKVSQRVKEEGKERQRQSKRIDISCTRKVFRFHTLPVFLFRLAFRGLCR